MQTWRVYIICFASKFHHAKHYIGITNLSLKDRFERHKIGSGAKITSAAVRAGIMLESIHEYGEKLSKQYSSSDFLFCNNIIFRSQE